MLQALYELAVREGSWRIALAGHSAEVQDKLQALARIILKKPNKYMKKASLPHLWMPMKVAGTHPYPPNIRPCSAAPCCIC